MGELELEKLSPLLELTHGLINVATAGGPRISVILGNLSADK